MTLAPFVRLVAQGKGPARASTQDEARQALTLILAGEAATEALAALLMVLRMRSEQMQKLPASPPPCAIPRYVPPARWPTGLTLISPATQQDVPADPLFALAAKLVAHSGCRVALHGWCSHQGTAADLRRALVATGILGDGLFYSPLETLNPIAFELLKLRLALRLRSCINTVLRMWNPQAGRASI